MNSIEVIECLKDDPQFIGTFSLDTLPKNLIEKPCKLVVNLDPSTKEGSHWIAIYMNELKQGYYFDPLGNKPPEEIETFLEKQCKQVIRFNQYIYQGDDSIKCGKFCIIFLYYCPNFKKFLRTVSPCEFQYNDVEIDKLFSKFF